MKLPKNQRGFSLIEVLIALVILSVIIFSFSVLLTNSYSGIFVAGRKTKALFTAQQQVESTLADIVYMESTIAAPGYSGGVNISPTTISVGTYNIPGKRIYVEIPYTDSNGNEVSLSVYTFVLQ